MFALSLLAIEGICLVIINDNHAPGGCQFIEAKIIEKIEKKLGFQVLQPFLPHFLRHLNFSYVVLMTDMHRGVSPMSFE